MVASASLTRVHRVDGDCPVCGRPLPPIAVAVIGRSRGKHVLSLEVVPRLDVEWWELAAQDHPQCVPGVLIRTRGDGR